MKCGLPDVVSKLWLVGLDNITALSPLCGGLLLLLCMLANIKWNFGSKLVFLFALVTCSSFWGLFCATFCGHPTVMVKKRELACKKTTCGFTAGGVPGGFGLFALVPATQQWIHSLNAGPRNDPPNHSNEELISERGNKLTDGHVSCDKSIYSLRKPMGIYPRNRPTADDVSTGPPNKVNNGQSKWLIAALSNQPPTNEQTCSTYTFTFIRRLIDWLTNQLLNRLPNNI